MTDKWETRIAEPANAYSAYARAFTFDALSAIWTGEIIEFPGCIAEGRNPAEVGRNLRLAADAWVAATLAQGQPVPEPRSRR